MKEKWKKKRAIAGYTDSPMIYRNQVSISSIALTLSINEIDVISEIKDVSGFPFNILE